MGIDKFLVKPNSKINLANISTGETDNYNSKKEASKNLKNNIKEMIKLQDKLYADDRYSMLLIFQAMDAAGKD